MEPIRSFKAEDIDLSNLALLGAPLEDREGAFATLRERAAGLLPRGARGPDPPARARLLVARRGTRTSLDASRSPKSSAPARAATSATCRRDFNEFFGSMINMDDPRHARLRGIVSRGFTPRMLDAARGRRAARRAATIVDAVDRARRVRLRHRHRGRRCRSRSSAT